MEQPSITFLNMTGDITITWDAQNEAAILALVEKKMSEGYSFFILKPRVLGLLGHKKVEMTDIEEARKAGGVVVTDALAEKVLARLDDADLEATVANGKARVVGRNNVADVSTARRAKTPAEVVRHPAVAVRRVVGG